MSISIINDPPFRSDLYDIVMFMNSTAEELSDAPTSAASIRPFVLSSKKQSFFTDVYFSYSNPFSNSSRPWSLRFTSLATNFGDACFIGAVFLLWMIRFLENMIIEKGTRYSNRKWAFSCLLSKIYLVYKRFLALITRCEDVFHVITLSRSNWSQKNCYSDTVFRSCELSFWYLTLADVMNPVFLI